MIELRIHTTGTAKQGKGYLARITGLSERYRFEREFVEADMDLCGESYYYVEDGIYEIEDCGSFDENRGAVRRYVEVTGERKASLSAEEVEAAFAPEEEPEEEKAETTRASEMTIGQIEDVLRGMDWTEIHKARLFSDWGDRIVLYADGTFSVQDSSTYHRDPDAAGVIGYLACWGRGNVDRTDYFEGWVERSEDGGYVETFSGRVLSEDEALSEAIEDGAWEYDEEIEAVLENARREREEAAHRG